MTDPFPPSDLRDRLHAATLVEGVSDQVAVEALVADPDAWDSPPGLRPRALERWRHGVTDPGLVHRYQIERRRLAALEGWISTPLDVPWLPGPGVSGVLRGRGTVPKVQGLGIIGSRKADSYGREIASRLARSAVERGLPVVSGGAYGVDIAAHRAALRHGGQTIVVLGAGLAHPCPQAHIGVFEKAVLQGAVVSCFPCERTPARWTFPRRNPWIAALSTALVVVQAGLRSGALLTAADALRLNRPVWVVPGPLDAPLHAGCHRLVDQGARLLTCIDQWATEFEQTSLFDDDRVPDHGRELWDAAGAEASSLSEIARRAGVSIEEAMVTATKLELTGWFRGAPGTRYARVRPPRRMS